MNEIAPCPSCQGNNLYRSVQVNAGGPYGPFLLPGLGSFWRFANFNLVVCEDCGLTRFFASREATAKLAESHHWTPIDAV